MKRSALKACASAAIALALSLSFFSYSQSQTPSGYIVFSTDGVTPIPVVAALFSFTNDAGVLSSQMGVGAVEPTTSGCLFIDRNGTETWITLVNPSLSAASVTLTLRDPSGNQVGQSSVTLEAGRQLAGFIQDILYGPAQGFTGSLTFTSSQKLAALSVRQSRNAQNETLCVALPAVDLNQTITDSTLVFPHMSVGAGNTTQLLLINRSSQPTRGKIRVFGDSGSTLTVSMGGVESFEFSYEIAAYGTYRAELDRTGDLRSGYVAVAADSGNIVPGGNAVFRYSTGGSPISETVVPATQGTTSARFFVDNIGTYTGVAITNLVSITSTVTFTLLDHTGVTQDSVTRQVPSGGHMAVFAHELFPTMSSRFTGMIEISSTTLIAPVTLRLTINERGDQVYTSLPVADLNHPPTAALTVIPLIAYGGNATTQLILLNSDKSRRATGRIGFRRADSSTFSLQLGNRFGSDFAYDVSSGGGAQFLPGNNTRLASFVLLNPDTNQITQEIAVNEGNTIKPNLLALDETGRSRDDFVFTYTSLDTSVATIDSGGYITGRKAGFSTMTISAGSIVITGTITVVSILSGLPGYEITGVAQDLSQRLYLAASQSHAILQTQSFSQAADIYAGTRGVPGLINDIRLQSQFRNPAFLTYDQARGTLYVSDSANNVIRRVQPGPSGRVDTLAGTGSPGSNDGAAGAATFNNPLGIALDNRGYLWVVDSGNHTIRRINLTAGTVETIAGNAGNPGWQDGTGTAARFYSPAGIALETEPLAQQLDRERRGEPPPPVSMIVADTGNGFIRRVKANGTVETVQANVPSFAPDEKASSGAGAKGKGRLRPRFKSPQAVAADPFGNIYVSEPGVRRVQTILQSGDIVSAAESKTFAAPKGIVVTQGGKVVVADSTSLARQVSYGEPQITNITPGGISIRGGETVTITGKNFGPGTLIIIAGQIINTIQSRNSNALVFTAPALPSGKTTLTVQNRAGLAQKSFLVEAIPLNQLPVGYITTVAGGSTFAGDGSLAGRASVASPACTAFDSQGNLYIADVGNYRIRKVSATTGVITTVAGTGVFGSSGDNGPATAAKLNDPFGIAVDSAGNLFIADSGNYRIRKVSSTTGIITTVAGGGNGANLGDNGLATAAALIYPRGIAVDSRGDLYIADSGNSRIRKVSATTGIITTVAGTGVRSFSGDGGLATAANLSYPTGVAVDPAGNQYIADSENCRIRKVSAATGIITTVAGTGLRGFSGDNGPATAANLSEVQAVALDSVGNIYIADWSNSRIRKVSATTGIITTAAGTGGWGFSGDNGPATAAKLYLPYGVGVDISGNLFIGDTRNNRIRKVSVNTGIITTFVGADDSAYLGDNEPAAASVLRSPSGITLDSSGNSYITDGDQCRIRKISGATGIITTVAGTGVNGYSGDNGLATAANLSWPYAVAVDSAGNLFISDSGNRRIRKVSAATGVITTFAGNGIMGYSGDGGAATAAKLHTVLGLAVDTAGNLFIADDDEHRIRKVSAATGIITTVAGTGVPGYSGDNGPATAAQLYAPYAVSVDSAGNVFIADMYNSRIRKVSASTGIITTVAGTGVNGDSGDNGPATAAKLASPRAVAVDSANNLFIADTGNRRIRKVSAATGIITSVAGTGVWGFSGDNGPAAAARFNWPLGIGVDTRGNVYISDFDDRRIRAVRGPIP